MFFMKNIELIAGGIVWLGFIGAMTWSVCDSFGEAVKIYQQSKEEGRSAYEICKEKGRSDVAEILY